MTASTIDLNAIARTGVGALRTGNSGRARAAFEQVVAAGAATPQLWLLLAQACGDLNDVSAQEAAIDKVLESDMRNLHALTIKADIVATRGDERGAVSFYQLALANVTPGQNLPPDLMARLRHAEIVVAQAGERFREHLATALDGRGAGNPRFAEALAILNGDQPVYLQQPTSFYYPRLPQITFYEPSDFPWLAAFTGALPSIRTELDAVVASDINFRPYVEADPSRANRGHALLNDPRWSALYLWQNGAAVIENARRCPATMAALAAAPMPQVKGRDPMALFSVLAPHTHIPPHHGMLNTRLICHLPLIVPEGCRLRVGGETRDVHAGVPMIFDDSMEHEAWNDSDETRIVLLFEIWRPEIDAEERGALTAMFEAIGSYPSAANPLSR